MQDRRVKRTRKSIFDALISLMLEKDIGHITVRELCEKADVNKSTFYLHFMDIYDCRDTWTEELMSEIFGKMRAVTYDEMINHPQLCLNALFDFFEKNLDFYIKVLNSPLASESIRLLKDRLTEIIFSTNNIDPLHNIEKAATISFYIGGVIDASILAMKNGNYNRDILMQVFSHILFN